jgi:D-alanyl-lipoteichoic acid acyltransferase DltB (MBOAT superfamily)
MLFNSFDFGIFLLLVYLAYWTIGVKKRTTQNILLLVSSYIFYGLWDWRFLLLIIGSSLVDYIAGRQINASDKQGHKKLWLYFSLFWNLGVLFTFKYFSFFIDNFTSLFGIEAVENGYYFWNVVIPVGLSFYTFQTLSYTIDVYRGKLKATHNLLEFLCFVSFFPQLVAGPIERAGKLLKQFEKKRSFDYQKTKEGLRQILWGLFKKMVVADNVSIAVNAIYDSPQDQGTLSLIYASILFFFQIYCDFSGYSDVAIGTAKLFGFKLSKNFNIPYLSRSSSDFWQRWHITLTRWFTDYVYAPFIKHKNKSYLLKTIGLFITMTLIGFWHGANWNFIAFGLLNAIVITMERIPIKIKGKNYSLISFLTRMPFGFTTIYIFLLIMSSCIFFRAKDIEEAYIIFKRLGSFIPSPDFSLIIGAKVGVVIILIFAEVFTRFKEYPLQLLEEKAPRIIRWMIYYTLIFIIFRYAGPKEQFIYFQF